VFLGGCGCQGLSSDMPCQRHGQVLREPLTTNAGDLVAISLDGSEDNERGCGFLLRDENTGKVPG
jgi:hypothetical protein